MAGFSLFDKNLLSLEVSIGKPGLYVKEILPQNVTAFLVRCSVVRLNHILSDALCIFEDLKWQSSPQFKT
jgi:hypothetical protein